MIESSIYCGAQARYSKGDHTARFLRQISPEVVSGKCPLFSCAAPTLDPDRIGLVNHASTNRDGSQFPGAYLMKDTPNVPPYSQVLDEIQEAGYVGTELGPYGYLPFRHSETAR